MREIVCADEQLRGPGLRQCTCKGRLGLERHGARTLPGLCVSFR